MAGRLSEDPSRNVLLLEAGPSHPPDGYPATLEYISGLTAEPIYTADLDAAIDAGVGTYYHGSSTAPMGEHDPGSVVDSTGRVHGLDALRVADASIFPEAISPPTNLTVLMVAERIAMAMQSS